MAPLRLLSSLFGLACTGCGALLAAASDGSRYRGDIASIEGTVEALDGASGPILVAALRRHRAEQLEVCGYDRARSDGRFTLNVPHGEYVVAAFRDVDGDLTFDPDEPAAIYDDWRLVVVSDAPPVPLHLVLERPMREPPADIATSSTLLRSGLVVPLEDPRFTAEVGELAEWEPYRFLRDYGAGIFLLGPHDPARIPVVFVHGMGGYPQEFGAVIARLDPARFEPWVVQYPSGWDLSEVSAYLYRDLSFLVTAHDVERLCIEAHSMGGLVARAALGLYASDRDRITDYVVHFMTLASPLGGHPAAERGVALSPVVLPAWRDLSPRSGFVAELYYQPLPTNLRYDLVYAFDHGDGDGVVPIRSQLRDEAQIEAASQRGFDLGHTEILRDDVSLSYWIERIEAGCR